MTNFVESQRSTPPNFNHDSVTWPHQPTGQRAIDVTTKYYANFDLANPGAEAPLIILPGYSEKDWAAQRALEVCTHLGVAAIAPNIDMEQIPATRQDLSHFAHNFAATFAYHMQQRYLGANSNLELPAMGHSMGGGLLGLGLQEAPELFNSVAFLEPVGHDTAWRLDQAGSQLLQFKWQLARVVLNKYNDITPADFYHAATGMIAQILADHWPPNTQRFNEKLRLSVTLDCGPSVLAHAATHDVAYIFGRNDPVVNGHHVLASLRMHVVDNPEHPEFAMGFDRLKYVFTDQPHSYMGWNHGAKHLRLGLAALGHAMSD